MAKTQDTRKSTPEPKRNAPAGKTDKAKGKSVEEVGGPKGPEPTRYNDWEKDGRCIDF